MHAPPFLRRAVLSGAGVPADELGALLGVPGDLVRDVRDLLFREREDGQPPAPGRARRGLDFLSHDDFDQLMRANRSAL